MIDIWKRFPGVIANAGATLNVERGTIHAVLGENGAGKSTLMNILSGVYRPDEGEVLVNGEQCWFHSPADALASGIGMVHQEFRLVPSFTVAENIVLGASEKIIKRSAIEREVGEIAHQFGLVIDPTRPVWQLSMGERQRVEILKTLWRKAQILILDEPTAVLTPAEADELGKVLGRMAEDGRTVIFISHKLHEVTAFCDEATVLRGGKTVASSLKVKDVNEGDLAGLMVGSSPIISERPPSQTPGEEMLTIRGLGTLDDRFLPAVKNLDLSVKSGEIVGIAGVSGNGQREMAQAIAGLRPITSGRVVIAGTDLTKAPPSERFTAGLGYVPEDRLGVGLAPRLTVTENAILRNYRSLRKRKLLVAEQASEYCKNIIKQFGVRTGSIDDPIAGLSGGNLQRLLVGRELSGDPKVVVAAQPTRGLDVQGVKAIQDLLIAERSEGVAVLLISEDLDELLTLSDRLLVMHEGEIVSEFDPATAQRHEIGAAMAGKKSIV